MAWGAPLQVAKGTATADVNTLSATFPGAVTNGSMISVGMLGSHFFGSFNISFVGSPTPCIDSKGNNYDIDFAWGAGGGLPSGLGCVLFSAWNVTGGSSFTVTVNGVNSDDGMQLYIAEFAGGPTTNSVFAFAGADGTSGAAASGNMDSSLHSGDLQIGLLFDLDLGSATITVDPALSPAFTEIGSDESAANGSSSTRPGGEMDYRVQTGTSNQGISYSARGGFDWVLISVGYAAPSAAGMPSEVQDYGPARSKPPRRPESYFSNGPANLLTAPSVPGNFMPVYTAGPLALKQRASDPQNNLLNFIAQIPLPAGAQVNNPLAKPFIATKSEEWNGMPDPLMTAPSIPGNFLPYNDRLATAPVQRPSDPQNNMTNLINVPPVYPAGVQMNNPLAKPSIAVKSEEWYGMPDPLLTAPVILPAGVNIYDRPAKAIPSRPADGQPAPLVTIVAVTPLPAGVQVYDRNPQPTRFRPVDAPQPSQSTLLLQGWANQAVSLWPSRALIVPKFRPEGISYQGLSILAFVPPPPSGVQWTQDRNAQPAKQRPVMDTPNELASLLAFVPPLPAGVNLVFERLASPPRQRPSEPSRGMPENLLTTPAIVPAGKQFWEMSAPSLRTGQLRMVAFVIDEGITVIVISQSIVGGIPDRFDNSAADLISTTRGIARLGGRSIRRFGN